MIAACFRLEAESECPPVYKNAVSIPNDPHLYVFSNIDISVRCIMVLSVESTTAEGSCVRLIRGNTSYNMDTVVSRGFTNNFLYR